MAKSYEKIDIPITEEFQKRLAELVWENCPELARQTAAGRMALAINVSDPNVTVAVVSEVRREVAGTILNRLLEASGSWIDIDKAAADTKEEVERLFKAGLQEMVGGMVSTIKSKADKAVDRLVKDEVMTAVRSEFGDMVDHERAFARTIRGIIEGLIREYLAGQLKRHPAYRETMLAAEAQMANDLEKANDKSIRPQAP